MAGAINALLKSTPFTMAQVSRTGQPHVSDKTPTVQTQELISHVREQQTQRFGVSSLQDLSKADFQNRISSGFAQFSVVSRASGVRTSRPGRLDDADISNAVEVGNVGQSDTSVLGVEASTTQHDATHSHQGEPLTAHYDSLEALSLLRGKVEKASFGTQSIATMMEMNAQQWQPQLTGSTARQFSLDFSG